MNKDQACSLDVLREFVDDVKSAYGVGDGELINREGLSSDWLDLLATYDNAVACLIALGKSTDAEPVGCWRCHECGRTLLIADWSYADLADCGTPMCGECDCEMELNQSAGDSDINKMPVNGWGIVDTDARRVAPRIYDEYEECAADAHKMDSAMIVGFKLPEQPADGKDDQEQVDE